MTKPLCIYHGNCADGFAAAWSVWKALGADNVDFHSGVYGQQPPDVTGRKVILVDFSYKRPVLEAMATQATSILILDHHKNGSRGPCWVPGTAAPAPRDARCPRLAARFRHLRHVRHEAQRRQHRLGSLSLCA